MTEQEKILAESREREELTRIKTPDFSQVPEPDFTFLTASEKFWITVTAVLLLICFIQIIVFSPN